jgi:hypothetical protein
VYGDSDTVTAQVLQPELQVAIQKLQLDTPLAVLIRRVEQQGGTWVNLRGVSKGAVQQQAEQETR